MKSAINQLLTRFSICLLFLFIFSHNISAQTTYKVVCDKTDNTVKIVETKNHSPNYVPIKSGFPFRQIAQKWIAENYSTTVCNPEDIINKIKEEEKKATVPSTEQTTTAAPPATTTVQIQPVAATLAPQIHYYNSSFIFNAKFSDLGRPFSLKSNFAPGFGVGFEQLFGKKYYLGIGLGIDFYFADFSETPDLDKFSFYLGKIPLFIGYRTYKNHYFIMTEVGAEFNTNIKASNEDFNFQGKIPTDNSYDFTARMKIGRGKFMLIMGTEIWMTELFKDDDYKMISVYLGLRLAF